MKLRLDENSLRLRLSEAEVGTFARTGQLHTTIQLGPQPFQCLTYALERHSSVAEVQIQQTPTGLTVLLPAAVADAWTSTGQNGISAALPLPNHQHLRILVEKDLDCRH